jgi:hypothetical protein
MAMEDDGAGSNRFHISILSNYQKPDRAASVISAHAMSDSEK